jgi:ABC transport system ATP-binding/permease protein
MSERILKALMQLFAIIARPESKPGDRRTVVESFLKQQLNTELVLEYLQVFDNFYNQNQQRHTEGKSKKRFSASSVRVLKICTEINEELIQKQKIIVLIRLLEFIKSDSTEEISEQEIEFVNTVANTFNLSEEEYLHIRSFVLNTVDSIPITSEILVINNNPEAANEIVKHICSDFLKGQILVLNVDSANMHVMRYLGESELYLNGQLIQQDKVYVLTTGSSIRNSKIRPIYYSDIISTFNVDKIKTKVFFEVKNIEFRFPNGKLGLHDTSFIEESGKLVGIMGASGAGKSTLLNVLNGTNPPTSGEILINGYNIHTQKHSIEGMIGFVAQDDLLIEELTVFENLYYNAKLCFDNLTEEQLVETVDKMLQSLGLFETKDMKVGSPLNKKISGGQRKRLNIALELIREPQVLFLDEPTSGLSSRDSENILDLLKELALKGKLVFVVIHQPSSDIFKMFDKLLILDTGGYPIYNGDPIDSIMYFKSRVQQADWNDSECRLCGNVNPEQIFNIVEAQVLDEYGNLTHTRKTSPIEWNAYYKELEQRELEQKEISIPDSLPEITFRIPGKLKQFMVFVKRDVLSKLTNKQYLVINLFEAPVLAFLLSYIIKFYEVGTANQAGYIFSANNNLPVYLFMAVIVALFMGLTVSAEEIIKDRKILKREAFLNLSRSSYLLSKVGILFTLSAIQALSFVLVGNTILEIKGMNILYWLMLFSTFCSANILGLNISDAFKTSVTIYILIPFLIIPQILLSGVIVKFDKLNPTISSPSQIPWYGEIITARWAYEALAVLQFKDNEYERLFYPYEKVMSNSGYKKDFWINSIDNKITSCQKNQKVTAARGEYVYDLQLMAYEIKRENGVNKSVQFKHVENLKPEKFNSATVDELRNYVEAIKSYYIKVYNLANEERDKKINLLQKTKEEKENFLLLKKQYFNENLKEFVANSNETVRIVEYKGKLYQKIDPIYLDPESFLIKAHFYSPRKAIFGFLFDTFWVNLAVLWSFTILLYLTLYFSLLKKSLEFFNNISPSKEE